MGQAIERAIEMVAARKQAYKSASIAYFRPWIFLITDGAPNLNDNWQAAAALIRQGEASKAFSFFSVGVKGADFEVLKQLCVAPRTPIELTALRFRDLFLWLSGSLGAVSNSSPGETVSLAAPGWGTVPA